MRMALYASYTTQRHSGAVPDAAARGRVPASVRRAGAIRKLMSAQRCGRDELSRGRTSVGMTNLAFSGRLSWHLGVHLYNLHPRTLQPTACSFDVNARNIQTFAACGSHILMGHEALW